MTTFYINSETLADITKLPGLHKVYLNSVKTIEDDTPLHVAAPNYASYVDWAHTKPQAWWNNVTPTQAAMEAFDAARAHRITDEEAAFVRSIIVMVKQCGFSVEGSVLQRLLERVGK